MKQISLTNGRGIANLINFNTSLSKEAKERAEIFIETLDKVERINNIIETRRITNMSHRRRFIRSLRSLRGFPFMYIC